MPEVNELMEEVLESIWYQKEDGTNSIQELLSSKEMVEVGVNSETLQAMESAGLVTISGDTVIYTAEGETLGELIIRRHRLAERLLSDILDVREEAVLEEHACSFEHTLSPVVADSICTLLGHPPSCPHGLPIPRGACCEKAAHEIKPLVISLRELPVGQSAKVVFIAPKTYKRLERLGSMGLVPGSMIKLSQKKPSFVVSIGQTTLAIEADIAADIHVKRVE